MPVPGVAWHGAHAHHQALFERGGHRHLHPKLIGRARFALADAFHLWGVQGVQLVLVFGLLRQDAAHPPQQVLRLGLLLHWQLVQLALHFALNTAHPGSERFDGLFHALVLLGMRIAPRLCGQPGGLSVVVLTQFNAVDIGPPHQVLAALPQQSAVGGVGYGLGHHRGVHNDFVGAARFEHATPARCINGHHQQGFYPLFTNALSPTCQARWINGAAGLQIALTREVLPIRVLHPRVDHQLIRAIKGVLQIQQARHQTRRQSRAAAIGDKVARESLVNLAPINQRGQLNQRVLEI